METLVKISFIGDLMCQKAQIDALKRTNKSYDIIFDKVRKIFKDSQYVVGNLETPIAGEKLGFSNGTSFNTPIEFIRALKKLGVTFVSTSNNHCLDRGIDGLEKTIDNLNAENIDFTGTYKTEAESKDVFVKEISGLKFAFICCTYGTNSEYNGKFLPETELWRVDLLRKQAQRDYLGNDYLNKKKQSKAFWKRSIIQLYRFIPSRIRAAGKALLGKQNLVKSKGRIYDPDNVSYLEISNPENENYVKRIIEKVNKAKKVADIVIVLPHSGGQYNAAPGRYEKYIVKTFAYSGADLVVSGHAHTSLRCEKFENGIIGAYALGNFCFTPYKDWFVSNTLSEYSIVMHTYWGGKSKKLNKITFSVTKTIVKPNGLAICVPVEDLFKERMSEFDRECLILENEAVVNRFRGTSGTVEIEPEYDYISNV